MQDNETINYRLPLEVRPFRYWLEIAPDFDNDTFTGQVRIEVKAIKNMSTITLHNNGLQMPSKDKIKIKKIGSTNYSNIESAGAFGTASQQFFQITLIDPLVVGTDYEISIPDFIGKFTTTASGFYYAVYEDENGVNNTFATTHFEPCSARKAFPCFDEPALKARFNLRIRRPSDQYNSVSNTPKNKNLSHGLLDVFKETEIMPTYLLSFIISEMNFSETLERHRILGTPEEIKYGLHKFALNKSYELLNAMEKYTGISYVPEKMDHAAIPKDYFYFQAMENWGLIIYNDRDLMIPQNASCSKKSSVLSVISHEIVHQWFGNLVTPEWWEYTWLSEGFANYLQHVIADKVEPYMDIEREMVVDTVQIALSYDGFSITRPMTSPGTDPDQIQNLFDLVSYSKSSSVIRMLEHVITTPVFKKGLNYYLNNRKFKTANPSQLYESFQKAVDENAELAENVSEFMKTWETEAGVPLVTVTRIYQSEEDNVQLKQRRFLNNQINGPEGKWKIPINFATPSDPSFNITTPDVWLKQSECVITLPDLNDEDWLIANKLQTGYYRVNYDMKNWDLLIKALLTNHYQINAINRAQLLDDCAFLAKSGDVPQDVNIRLQRYLVNEVDPIPLAVQQNTFRHMDSLLSNSDDHEYFQKHVLGILQNTYARLTFYEVSNDKPMVKKLRADVLYWLCKVGHHDCRQNALAMFRAWKKNQKEIPADLQSPVFCGAMRVGNNDDFNYLLNYFIETRISYFEELFGSSLVCVENKTLVKEVLEYSFNKNSSSLIKSQIKAASESSKFGLQAVIEFVQEHYNRIEERLQPKATNDVIESIAIFLPSDQQLVSFGETLTRSAKTNIFLKLQTILNKNKAWREEYRKHLLGALKQHGFNINTKYRN
ncbi:hypothetical protein RN001_004313 [Aquatica leii]|uniref:Aminopeptidase n=1 Tax=Aquatica leii TaxID=1421715 RepID=A0AAN7SI03_9COLE|nr:hypothetical protein RN001_004313 [Aquatica leii]